MPHGKGFAGYHKGIDGPAYRFEACHRPLQCMQSLHKMLIQDN